MFVLRINFTTKDNFIPNETITIYELQTYFGAEPMSLENKNLLSGYTTQSETEF